MFAVPVALGQAVAGADLGQTTPDAVARALRSLREHLQMDLAFISEFGRDDRLFRYVDTVLSVAPIQAGDTMPMDEGYCRKVVEGRLPQLIPDTAQCPDAMAIPDTTVVPIGAHVSVPLRREDGAVYGTLCCFSLRPDPTLNQRDLNLMHAFAELIGQQIVIDVRDKLDLADKRRRIGEVIENGDPAIVYQPIFRLHDYSLVASEALARFSAPPVRSPDKWFNEAEEVGLRTELERQAIANALRGYEKIWTSTSFDISVNSSPETVIQGDLLELFKAFPRDRIILEITEHERVEDYEALTAALTPLRALGIRIAIDDAGAGFASLRHILHIGPDIIKLDVSLTRDIDRDPRKKALAQAFVTFGHQIDSEIIAEGVETSEELAILRALGVDKAQGYLLGRPETAAHLLSHEAAPCV
jgi:EAL domain-containing protein (putative c-di-GMP-specific phosphodiesterase class I)